LLTLIPGQDVDIPLVVGGTLVPGDTTFSPLTGGLNANKSSLGHSIGTNSYDDATIGENTIARETKDKMIKALNENDANEVGDGGTSDAEGDGYKCVVCLQDGMKEVDSERLCFDAHEIESGVEVDDIDLIVCSVKDLTSKSRLYGAPPGWSAPGPPDDWNPTINLICGKPRFEEVDNPGKWSNFTFRSMFEPNGGKYICHSMPAGTVPVPTNAKTGKRELGEYEFFYQGWKNDNPTRENCRFGASRENLFSEDRDVNLDGTFLKKLGLTMQKMVEGNALFFYQLLLPIVDPAMSGIKEDTRMGYYTEVARNTNLYAFVPKNRGGTRGHVFCPTAAEELLVWDGIVCQNLNTNIAECWMMNQTNTFDQEIMEAMHFRRWVDIKACLNSLTAIGGPDRQLYFELRARVVSPQIFCPFAEFDSALNAQ
jgi:hypothetical protein